MFSRDGIPISTCRPTRKKRKIRRKNSSPARSKLLIDRLRRRRINFAVYYHRTIETEMVKALTRNWSESRLSGSEYVLLHLKGLTIIVHMPKIEDVKLTSQLLGPSQAQTWWSITLPGNIPRICAFNSVISDERQCLRSPT